MSARRLRLAAYVFVVMVAAGGLWRVETTARRAEDTADALAAETESNERQRCAAANESRETVREIATQVGVESAEAIIDVATSQSEDPPEPAVIEAYREATQRRMEAIAGQLEDRDCEAEARERAEE